VIGCIRERLTPAGAELFVDCTVHGLVGIIPAGEAEFERAETVFSLHRHDVAIRSGFEPEFEGLPMVPGAVTIAED
jgi:hypothetical protein